MSKYIMFIGFLCVCGWATAQIKLVSVHDSTRSVKVVQTGKGNTASITQTDANGRKSEVKVEDGRILISSGKDSIQVAVASKTAKEKDNSALMQKESVKMKSSKTRKRQKIKRNTQKEYQ